MIFKASKRLFGTKLLLLFFLTIPLGVAVGFVEIGFGFALQNFLASYQLIPQGSIPFYSFISQFRPTVLLLVMAFFQLVLNIFNSVIPNITSEGLQKRVRTLLSINAIGSTDEEHSLSVTEVSHIIMNLTAKAATFFSYITQLTSALLIVITIVLGMMGISAYLTLLSFAILVVFALPMSFLKSSFQRFSTNVYAYTGQFTRTLMRNLRNIYFLRILGTHTREMENSLALNKKIFRNYLKYIFGITTNGAMPLFLAVLIVVMIVKINDQHHFIAAASVVPFVYLLTRLSTNMSRGITAIGYLQFTRPFFIELLGYDSFFSAQYPADLPETESGIKEVPHELRVSSLGIGRKKSLMKDLAFNLKRGEFLLVSGKSGKGKTTLLMTLIGIVPKMHGEILWNGKAIETLNIRNLKNSVGYSGADPFLFDDTLEENLLYGSHHKEIERHAIPEALEIAQCAFVSELPGNLRYKLREGGEGISAGQKQRLSIARALLRKPSILMLDEATANIDEATEEAILKEIRQRYPEMTIIAVSHRSSLKQFATRVLEL